MLARIMRSRLWSTSLLVGLCLLTVACAASTPATAVTSPPLTSSPTTTNASGTPYAGVRGMPAITPHLNLAANARGGSAPLPTFTADDTSAYVTANPLFYKATGTVTIRSVTFLPQEQANQWPNLDLNVGLPAGTLLCVVVLDGSFTDTTNVSGSTLPATTYSHVIVVFDGVTGNLLRRILTNSLPAAPATPTTPTTPGTGISTPTS